MGPYEETKNKDRKKKKIAKQETRTEMGNNKVARKGSEKALPTPSPCKLHP